MSATLIFFLIIVGIGAIVGIGSAMIEDRKWYPQIKAGLTVILGICFLYGIIHWAFVFIIILIRWVIHAIGSLF